MGFSEWNSSTSFYEKQKLKMRPNKVWKNICIVQKNLKIANHNEIHINVSSNKPSYKSYWLNQYAAEDNNGKQTWLADIKYAFVCFHIPKRIKVDSKQSQQVRLLIFLFLHTQKLTTLLKTKQSKHTKQKWNKIKNIYDNNNNSKQKNKQKHKYPPQKTKKWYHCRLKMCRPCGPTNC